MNVIPEHINFDEVCRSCMAKKDGMRPLFGSSLDSMLMTVANVKVARDDGYPAQMCVQCVLQVSRAFTFKQQCEKTDITLKEYLSRVLLLQQASGDNNGPENVVQIISIPSEYQSTSIGNEFDGGLQEECVLVLSTERDPNELDDVTSIFREVEVSECGGEQDCNQVKNTLQYTPLALDENIVDDDHFGSDVNADEPYVQEAEEMTVVINAKPNLCRSEVFKCEDCNREFKSNLEMKEHKFTCMVMTSSNVHDSTNLARKTRSSNDSENSPSYNSAVILRFECEVCNKRFSNTSKLKRHSRTHLVDKPHVCNICGMSFAESSNLTKHHRKHTGELRNVVGKPNLCSVCGKRFKWATSLSKHMKHHTKLKLFTCPYPNCAKYYVEQRSLDIHIYSHDGKKPFTCGYCTKGFTQKCNLEKHERVHTGEKPFKCNFCHKSFAQSGYLVIHQRIHSQEKPYNCDECGKQFAASNALTVHLRSHSGERPYACDLCDKRFSRQETLTIHKTRKHSNDASHLCTICSERFPTTEQLTEHLKSQHGDRCYHMCPSCGKVFASMQSLKNHQKVHLKEGTISEDQPQPMIQFVVEQEIVTQTVDLAALEKSGDSLPVAGTLELG
ncbi:zinc finger protein 883 isoform X1 [Aedes albopictus]|uniref:C2h2-type zn-finger protein n=1 Tax=Aedes albopictus TaxID=7160 RepID=A0ABM1Y3L3_AEDAL|nr:zinc finger protein 883 [Aedes albopictus]